MDHTLSSSLVTDSTGPSLQHATIAELLMARAQDSHRALAFEDQEWTWREFLEEASRRAGLLEQIRPTNGPWHVGVLSDNTPEYLFLIAGAALCGATVVGVNPTRRGTELAADIRATDCAVIVADEAYAHLLEGIDHGAERVLEMADADYQALVARQQATPAARPDALDPTRQLLLLFTSGSTGAPKAVICSTGRWAYISQANPIEFTSDDVAYNAMPLFHGNALMSAFGPILAAGGAFAMRRRFSASGFSPDIRRFGATFFNYVGRSLSYVLAQPESPEDAQNRLRFGFGTEASLPDRREFQRRYGARLFESYGSSEGTVYISVTEDTPEGALGRPQAAFTVDIVNASGEVCPPAEFDEQGRLLNAGEAVGEIVSRGAAARFEGYYRNPQAEREKLRDGDFWTGDLAYVDRDGFYWFAGRTADWLRVDSENFAAAPLERILSRFPGVAAVAVYPVPDPVTGDRVMATLQLDAGSTLDPYAFREFLADQQDLGTKWLPALVRVTAQLPTTATLKVDKPAMRRRLWQGDDDLVLEHRDGAYVPMTAERRQELHEQFVTHGRENLLPR